jgi:hypothetical protein
MTWCAASAAATCRRWSCQYPGQRHAATVSMAALRAAVRDRRLIGHIHLATTHTDWQATRRDGPNNLRPSHCSRDLVRRFLRSSQTIPATAPRIITAPIAMNQVMMPKISPIVPYVLLSEMIVSEK